MILSLLLVSYMVQADDVDITPAVRVTGSCLRSAQPDQVEVQIGVRTRQADAVRATEVATAIYEKALKKAKSLNLKNAEFATTTMSVSRVYEYENNRQVQKGFEANYAFRVTTSELARAGEIFKVAKETGANEVAGPWHGLSKKLFQKEYEACLGAAAENARSKAEVIAKSLSAQLSGRFQIEETEDGAVIYGRSRAMMAEASFAKDAAPSVEAKNEDVKVSLRATFYLK